jgi:hypothetical protein
MNTLLRVALIAALSATCCLAQTGTVAFFTPGISAKSEAAVFLPKSQQPFTGLGPTGPGKGPLVINVKDGGQYCVRLFAKMIDLGVYGQWDNPIEEIPCQ